jgi:hypothetical protein
MVATNDFASILLFLLCIFVEVESGGVSSSSHVDPEDDVTLRTHPRMSKVVAIRGPMAFAVRQIFHDGWKSRLFK